MAFKRYEVDNFYVTTVANDYTLNPWVDGVMPLVSVPNIEDWKLFFVVFRVNDPANRVVIPVYMDWWFVKYKWYNITSVIDLYKYDSAAINDVAELFNVLFELTDDIWKVVKKVWLNIMVYWWEAVIWNTQYSLPDTDITLDDNATNYIILDYSDQQLKSVTTLPSAYYLFDIITTSWWAINTISRKRAFNVQNFFSALFFDYDTNWETIIKDWSITWLQIDFASFDSDDINEWGGHLFMTPAERIALWQNTAARHTHSNKALLDTYDQTNTDLADAVTKKHDHANKILLDLLPDLATGSVWDTFINLWTTVGRWSSWGWWSWTTIIHTDIFLGDWVSNTFVLSHTPLNDNAIFMKNDSWQEYFHWIDYSRVGTNIVFNEVADAWRVIYVKYFEQISVAQVWETNTMMNLPWWWIGVYKQKSWVEFQMRKVRGINWITVTQLWDEIIIDWQVSVWPWGEANTASNIWSWEGLYKTKQWVDLQFRTIGGSPSIDVNTNTWTDTIELSVNSAWLSKTFYRHFMY